MIKAGSRIFLSHTQEFRRFPEDRPFLSAAESAVIRAGCVVTDMNYFGARDEAPAAYCDRVVAASDVYVGIIGFRFGSSVRGLDDVSHVQLEFQSATKAGIPRLVFFLDQSALVPLWFSDVDRSKQDKFREELRSANVITATFRSPEELELAVYDSLIQIFSEAHALASSRRLWMVPPEWGEVVPRKSLMDQLVNSLCSPEITKVAVTTALQGAGGFGKTTLAAEACRVPEVRRRFPGGILWVTIGAQTAGADLSEKINDLSEVISGSRPRLSDPEHAGAHLGELLDASDTLLVIDDVWTRTQLRPFLIGGSRCVRLITTRMRIVLPEDTFAMEVDAMEESEAYQLLALGLQTPDRAALAALFDVTGRWPVLLSLVNSTIRRLVSSGSTLPAAAEGALERLTKAGPTALDVRKPDQRNEAVAATVGASLEFLDDESLDRYIRLAILPEDVNVPGEVLEILWGGEERLETFEVQRFCEELADLSLVESYSAHPLMLRLHDVLRQYLRTRCGLAGLKSINETFIRAAAKTFTSPVDSVIAWWTLPPDADYFWRFLPYHISEAGKIDELRRLLLDLKWISAKLIIHGPVAVGSDLSLLTDDKARELRRAIDRSAPLLGPIDPASSLCGVLVSRLDGIPLLKELTDDYILSLEGPRLLPSCPVPDQPHPGQRWSLPNGRWRVLALAVGPSGSWLAGGGEDPRVRIWDISTGAVASVLEGSTDPVWTCAASPDGKILATAGDDHVVRIWDVRHARLLGEMNGHTRPVRASAFTMDGQFLVTGGDDSTLRVWDVQSLTLIKTLRQHSGRVRCCAISPDGLWLASGGDNNEFLVWNLPNLDSVKTLQGHQNSIWACTWSPVSDWVASATEGGEVRLWSPVSGKCIYESESRTVRGPVLACGGSPPEVWIASGGDEGTIRFWDVATKTTRATLGGHSGQIRVCATDPAGKWIATAGDDQTVRVWEISTATNPPSTEGHIGTVWTCASSETGPALITLGADCGLREWNVSDYSSQVLCKIAASPQWACALSFNGDWIATAGADGKIRIWSGTNGSHLRSLPVSERAIWALERLGNDNLLSVGEDGIASLWNIPSASEIARLSTGKAPMRALAVGGPNGCFATVDQMGFLRLWTANVQIAASWKASDRPLWACALNADAGWVAVGGDDPRIGIWDLESKSLRLFLDGHKARVRHLAINRELSLLASVSLDGELRVWDAFSGRCLTTMRTRSELMCCCWIRQSNKLAAVGGSGVYLFDFLRDTA